MQGLSGEGGMTAVYEMTNGAITTWRFLCPSCEKKRRCEWVSKLVKQVDQRCDDCGEAAKS